MSTGPSSTDPAKKAPEIYAGWRHLGMVLSNDVPRALTTARRLLAGTRRLK